MVINKELSQKIKHISLISTVFVVLIHSVNVGMIPVFRFDFDSFIQSFISGYLSICAVPMFFIISGFLFFQRFDFTVKGISYKYMKMFIRLVLPYLFWSISTIFFFLIMQTLPYTRLLFSNPDYHIANYDINILLYRIFIYPLADHLWYIRDLVVLILISPLIFLIVDMIGLIYLLSLFFIWLVGYGWVFSNEITAITFFSLGSYIAIDNIAEKYQPLVSKNKCIVFLLIWIIVSLIIIIQPFLYPYIKILQVILYKISIVFGLLSLWYGYEIFKSRLIDNSFINKLSDYNFFIYLFHFSFMSLFKKFTFSIISFGTINNLIVYMITPFITIYISYILGVTLKHRFASFYSFITGGR
jgi:surface polysaccharide O-acyltransferase-like enzyme